MDYVRKMIALGYRSYYKVLNAKDYGIPQNRERVFTVSILGEHKPYVFPEKEPLHLRLIDLLEKNVDESYYLSDKMIEKFTWTKNGYNNAVASQLNAAKHRNNANSVVDDGQRKPSIRRIGDLNKGGQKGEVLDANGICSALTSTDYEQPKQIVEPVAEIKQVGQLYGTETEPNPQAGRVYDAEGLAPTMDTCSGGNRMPKIVEPVAECQQVGNVFGNDGKEHQSTAVYNVDGVAPTVCAVASKGVIKVAEPANVDSEDAVGCAIRNREDGEQLEFRKDNLVSALHGNLMKSMVATPEVTTESKPKRQMRRIGLKQEQLVEQVETDEQKTGAILTAQSVDPDAVIDVIDGTKKGFASAPMFASIDTSYAKWNKRRGRVQKDVAHTLVTSGNEQAVVVPADEIPDAEINHVGWVEGENGKTHQSGAVYGTDGVAPSQCVGKGAITRIMEVNPEPVIAASRGRVISNSTNSKGGVWTQQLEVNDRGVCNTISTVQKDNYVVEPTTSVKFWIRRLVPIECFRLMGFSDEAFKLAEAVNSNSQLYSQAGNSICVPCLTGIVRQLLKSVDFEGLEDKQIQ